MQMIFNIVNKGFVFYQLFMVSPQSGVFNALSKRNGLMLSSSDMVVLVVCKFEF